MFQKCHKFYPTFVQFYHVSTMNHLTPYTSSIHNITCLPQSIICSKYIIGPQYNMSPTIYHVSTINHHNLACVHNIPCVPNTQVRDTSHLPRVLAPVLFCSVWFVAEAMLRLPLFPALPPPRHSRRIVVSSHLGPWRPHQPEGEQRKTLVLSRSVKHCTENHTTTGSIAWLDTPRYRTNSTNM